jgi:hypothetical protein
MCRALRCAGLLAALAGCGGPVSFGMSTSLHDPDSGSGWISAAPAGDADDPEA